MIKHPETSAASNQQSEQCISGRVLCNRRIYLSYKLYSELAQMSRNVNDCSLGSSIPCQLMGIAENKLLYLLYSKANVN